MIIVKIMGGIGNQMFQYAMGRNLALMKNTTLKLDITWFNHFNETTTPRYYSLPEFNIVENIASDKEIKKMQKYKIKLGRRHFLYNLFFANNSIYIKEKQVNFDKNILEVSNNVYLDGYWQSEKYFENNKDIIREEFVLTKEPSEYYKKNLQNIKLAKSNSISLHIRRTDYINDKIQKSIGLCPMDYYHKAIEEVSRIVKNPVFFVFSDDIEWVKKNLKLNYPAVYISGDGVCDYEDLILMSLCKHNIIANSSFSWWGAWLNKNSNKIVIAPQKWFRKLSMNSEDIVPKAWIQI